MDDHRDFLGDYVGKLGLSSEKLGILVDNYSENPCITLLERICRLQLPPFKCPPLLIVFFRSIRKTVCPAVNVMPRAVWEDARIFLGSNDPSVQLVRHLNLILD